MTENEKEFKITFYKTVYFIVFLICLWFSIKFFLLFFRHTLNNEDFLNAFFATAFLFFITVGGMFFMLYLGSTRVVITDDEMIIKRPWRIQKVKWSDVKKIRRIFAIYSGYAYYIYTDNNKFVWIQDMFQNMSELLKLIQEKSGKHIKGEFSKDKN
ncbi:MAG: hypothetical protein HQL26_09530 [Candidatus Omnitrophica bacterium]|nr:hypothetical protein [Candidatus Omnitrophota bacterium]